MNQRVRIIAAACGILVVVVLALGGYGVFRLWNAFTTTQTELASTTAALTERTTELNSLTDQSIELRSALTSEQTKNSSFSDEVSHLSSTVGILQKVVTTDAQLLAKYSRVYFLNENYKPASLSSIDSTYVYGTKDLEFLTPALPYLERMIRAAADDGVDIRVISSYRSFGQQAVLKSGYTVTYGSGANKFSADQGYSEHQLGTAVDLTTPTLAATFTGFDKSTAYTWLTENAYKYGFILSYPKGNTYYQFEPWHWRFVGIDLATKLHNEGKNFYDLDQRDIDAFLPVLFD